MKIGFVGLGKMGRNMVLRLLEQGIDVTAFNRSPEPLDEVVNKGAIKANSLEDLVNKLESPRIIWLMLTAGEVTNEYINKLLKILKTGDLIIDGGNSYYKDSVKRAEDLKQKGIRFMDVGVSGGPKGARSGACLTIGGEREDFEKVSGLIKAIAAPNAYGYFGKAGAGHFVKMVHNGIEYGMMEAIAEGASILENSPFNLDLKEVFRIYNKGSVVESRLVSWLLEALMEDPKLKDISSTITQSGEGEWTVESAKEIGIDVPVLEDSVGVRKKSMNDKENSPEGFRNKAVSAMRGKFGGHFVKKV